MYMKTPPFLNHFNITALLFTILIYGPVKSRAHTFVVQFFKIDKLILIPTKVDSVEGFLILDTGIKYPLLNNQFFSGFSNKQNLGGVTGAVMDLESNTCTIKIGDHLVKSVPVSIGSLESFWKKKIEIIGLSGWAIFEDYEILIDYSNRVIILTDLSDHYEINDDYQNHLYESYQFIEQNFLRKIGPVLAMDLDLSGKPVTFSLDYGAESNLLDNDTYKKQFKQAMPVINSNSICGFGGCQKFKAIQADDIKLNGLQFDPSPMTIVPLWMINNHLTNSIDGILGQPFLSQYAVSLNIRDQLIRFYARSDPKQQSPIILVTQGSANPMIEATKTLNKLVIKGINTSSFFCQWKTV